MRFDLALGQFMAYYLNRHLPKEAEPKQVWDLMPYIKEPEWTLDQLQEMWK
jgi:hypothetical protein